jgi:ABC-type metal ion transport system substrate-binding protein
MDRTSLYRALPALEREGLIALASPSPAIAPPPPPRKAKR